MTIKKFEVTYREAPKVFGLPEDLLLSTTADAIPEEVEKQSDEQKAEVKKVIEQLNKDLFSRSRYADFNYKASELRKDWITINPDNSLSLPKGVYPSFTQGNETGGSLSVTYVNNQLGSLLSVYPDDDKSTSIGEMILGEKKQIAFAYKNARGEPSGLTLIAVPTGGGFEKYKGWMISTVQNTIGSPDKQKLTLLANNYIESEAQSLVSQDNLEQELKVAINNDKIFQLIKGVFNQDGSLNVEYINELADSIEAGINIYDRDARLAQLECLFSLSDDEDFQRYVNSIKERSSKEIDFFKDKNFETNLNEVSQKLASSLKIKTSSEKKEKDIQDSLRNISYKVAQLEKLADINCRNVVVADSFKALAEKIKTEAKTIKFDGTPEDEDKIKLLSQFNLSEVEKNVKEFSKSKPANEYIEAKKNIWPKYIENKEKIWNEKTKAIEQLVDHFEDENQENFLGRYVLPPLVGVAVAALVVLIILASVLSAGIVLTPLILGLAIIGGIVVGGGFTAGASYLTEKIHSLDVAEHNEERNEAFDKVNQWATKENNNNYNKSFKNIENELQNSINLQEILGSVESKLSSTNEQPQEKIWVRAPASTAVHGVLINETGNISSFNAMKKDVQTEKENVADTDITFENPGLK